MKALRAYVSGAEGSFKLVSAMDSQYKAYAPTDFCARDGVRHYINGDATRLGRLITFCFALEGRLNTLRPDQDADKPMLRPRMYVGYNEKPEKRSRQHEKKSTSWLQHLVDSAFQVTHPEGRFALVQHTIVHRFSLHQLQVAEIVFTAITDSKYVTSGGLCVCDSGGSTPEPPEAKTDRDGFWMSAET